ncbi:uracil-DNA glycosylase [Legionella longbeachae]|uniref:Type-4 uracil-DNA glycosylase n=1 Tax=Legionella longbeachae serogroup 1 (strain NSW150) TaxID=661367 RepID=D3HKB0_LEGLN|nr:uracil-DNA glycosylase [Legionella longbeachae]VEE03390.1 C-terminal part of DNA polymerase, bacteriophage-type [Legionella oakridgensis]HBD7397666.1 uracil-DNA glycosylase [Legionella pneumophila]ARB93716.1 uracil-DNA glycosylase [Legionella longbeachae]EEZ94008.1 uracil-DNA glycosylase family 4 protein [Legionella longbeachae D-4968]QEY52288.1 uracil-DNA glycosylase [Legionella longbeachae]
MPDELKHYYLQIMGIDLWKLRQSNSCQKDLSSLAKEVSSCTRCPLHKTRTQTVFYRGHEKAKLMIVGEAPGFYEDQQGLPFVGKAGGLLNQMLRSIEMVEKDVYIANVLKCRPPDNRDPHLDEIAQCSSFLVRQIELVKPHLILALGRFAGQFLLNKPLSLKQLRNTIHHYNNIPFIVSYHPAYLLRNPSDKKKTYIDLLTVKKLLAEKMS